MPSRKAKKTSTSGAISPGSIRRMDEDDLREKIIRPLLEAQGYRDVVEWHHTEELGKDFVCWMPDENGGRVNYAIVVKAQPFTGKAKPNKGTAGEIVMQVLECFGSTYPDVNTGKSQCIERCIVINSHSISPQAAKSIWAGIDGAQRKDQVRLIHGKELWDLAKQYLENAFMGMVEEARIRGESLHEHYRRDVSWDANVTTVTINEKYPGAFDQHPIILEIADSQAGKAVEAVIAQVHVTGEPVTLTEEQALALTFPADLVPFEPFDSIMIQLPEPVRTMLTRITFDDDEHEPLSLNNIQLDFIQTSPHEVLLTNLRQPHPFILKFKVSLNANSPQMKLSWQSSSRNVADHYLLARLQTLMRRTCAIRITEIATHWVFMNERGGPAPGEPPSPWWVDRLKDLTVLQDKTGVVINLPDRDLTPEDIRTISQLGDIVRIGRLRGTWTELSTTLRPGFNLEAINAMLDGSSVPMKVMQDASKELFDVTLPLGQVELVYHTHLTEPEAIKEQIQRSGNQEPIFLHFVPGDDNTVYRRYLKWDREQAKGE